MMRKKATKTRKRAKKDRIKDLEPKADPKGGGGLATDNAGNLSLNFDKVDYVYKPGQDKGSVHPEDPVRHR